MADDATLTEPARRRLAPGELVCIASDRLQVHIAPSAGGRVAHLAFDGVEWLCGYGEHAEGEEAIAWGCYPMLPWAGRIRHGRFGFDGRVITLPPNLGPHAIHGVAFVLPWQVQSLAAGEVMMQLELPRDDSWPFGGTATQRIVATGSLLRLELSLTAGEQAMPRPVPGWHPWFRKPDRLEFNPAWRYPRDAEGLATLPLAPPAAGPWDDCFIHAGPITLHRGGRSVQLRSDCDHWVVFDEKPHATCVEPQGGPPDVFNLRPAQRLAPGGTVSAWFELEWGG